MHTSSYDIFGELVSVHTDDDGLRRSIDRNLGAFRTTTTAATAAAAAALHIRCHPGRSPIAQGKQLHSGGLMIVADRHKLIAASLSQTPWQIHIDTYGRDDLYIYYHLFEPLLHMVLKRRGLSPWHGAAVQRRGHNVLIVGESGSGKSTTALSLLLNGYGYVADDELFLDSRRDLVRAQSVEEVVHFTDATAALLPALRKPSELPLVRRGHGMKRRLDAAAFSAAAPAAAIRCIVFPRVEPGGATELRPLGQADTVRRLLLHPPKEYPAVAADPESLRRHFATCASLATSAAAFELVLGRDLDRTARLIDQALP